MCFSVKILIKVRNMWTDVYFNLNINKQTFSQTGTEPMFCLREWNKIKGIMLSGTSDSNSNVEIGDDDVFMVSSLHEINVL